jgi:hypothetical protein
MTRLPSIRTLRTVFADRAPEARRILEMTRSELMTYPEAISRASECYHPPQTFDLRLEVLASIDSGLHGIEGFDLGRRDGTSATLYYLNAGDTYTTTLTYWAGRYRVESWGDRVETLERQGWR